MQEITKSGVHPRECMSAIAMRVYNPLFLSFRSMFSSRLFAIVFLCLLAEGSALERHAFGVLRQRSLGLESFSADVLEQVRMYLSHSDYIVGYMRDPAFDEVLSQIQGFACLPSRDSASCLLWENNIDEFWQTTKDFLKNDLSIQEVNESRVSIAHTFLSIRDGLLGRITRDGLLSPPSFPATLSLCPDLSFFPRHFASRSSDRR